MLVHPTDQSWRLPVTILSVVVTALCIVVVLLLLRPTGSPYQSEYQHDLKTGGLMIDGFGNRYLNGRPVVSDRPYQR